MASCCKVLIDVEELQDGRMRPVLDIQLARNPVDETILVSDPVTDRSS